MQLHSRVYDVLKKIAQLYLPAAGALYFALAGIWGLPASEQVTGSVVALDTFLGGILSLSAASYNNSDAKYDGSMVGAVAPSGKTTYTLVLNDIEPEDLVQKDQVTFKVDNSAVPPPAAVTA